MRRWFVLLSWLLLLAIVGAILTLPWWLGAAIRGLGPRYGVTIARYEPLGYARFALHDVRFQRGNVTVTADRVEADTPLRWVWQHLRGTSSPVVGTTWSVEVAKSSAPTRPTGPSGWVPLRQTLRRVAAELDRWMPDASVGPGSVRWPGGELAIAAAHWLPGRLAASKLSYRALSADVNVAFESDDEIKLVVTQASNGATVAATSRGATVAGSMSIWDQRVTIEAAFGSQGWRPSRAGLQADELDLPGSRLKLADLYSAVRGHAYLGWETDHFVADVVARGEPAPGKKVPPLEVNLRGRGGPNAFQIQAVDLVAPGVVAHLTAPVTIDRTGHLHESAARFWIRADLSQQHWIDARGTATGDASLAAEGPQTPAAEFHFSADGLAIAGVNLQHAALDGRLTWPELRVDRFDVVGGPNDELHGRGEWNFRSKTANAVALHGRLRRATVARWVPASLGFETAEFQWEASGPESRLAHAGRIEAAGVKFAGLNPAKVHVDWRGEGPLVRSFEANAEIGATTIIAGGAADLAGMNLTRLRIERDHRLRLQLAQPALVRWKPALAIGPLQLSGADAELGLRLAWGTSGRIDVNLRNLPSEWIADVYPLRGPAWIVTSLAISGSWDHGPMRYSAAGGATFSLPENRSAAVNLAIRGDENGASIEALHGIESGHDVINASGRLPLTIAPGTSRLTTIDPNGGLTIDAATVPNAAFWQELGAMTGVEMRDPEVHAHLTGTWKRPQGELSFRAGRLAMDPKRFARPLPSVDGLDVKLTGDPAGLRLEHLALAIEGQALRASGRLPIPEHDWSDLSRDPLGYLRRGAQMRLEIPDAQVAAFSRFLPAALAPAGRLEADVRYDRGLLGGFLRLHDAASRPLGPLGVLQQVNAEVAFSDHEVDLQHVSATSGGEPIELSGRVVLPNSGWLGGKAAEPSYDVTVRGRNLPFVRQAGLLVRGDLDLKLTTPDQGPPRISGKVLLRDSLFLADVRAFLPRGGGTSPSRRPPYFAVETPPLDTWVLDVDLVGDRFLRLQTPVFSGVASARFHLGGTLGAPRAIGDAKVDEGMVSMPFATFEVTQGAVRLTEDDPYEPTIYLRGTGRRYGYDLTLEMDGKASAPSITFRSSPSLDPEQVMMMVMTGAAPANEVNTSITHRAMQFGAFFGRTLLGSVAGGSGQEDRLSIESGEKISQQGNETYDIEYKLSDRWTLTGEYDEFDEYNVGLKWRVAPKKKPR